MKNHFGFVLLFLMLSACDHNAAEAPPAKIPEGRLPQTAPTARPQGTPTAMPPACAAMINPDVEEGAAPLRVNFTADGLCSDADGEFSWDFGDGSPVARGERAEHVYQKPGEYIAKLTLTDVEHGVSDTDEAAISVGEAETK